MDVIPGPVEPAAREHGGVVATLSVTAIVTLSVLPVILTGAAAVLIAREEGMAVAQLGATITLFFLAGAATMYAGGRVADRVGPRPVLRLSAVLSSVTLLLVGWVVEQPWHLQALLTVAGAANGFTQPATNLAMQGVARRVGVAFGVKYSSVPLASLVAGAIVPTLGVEHGWRVLFLAAGAGGLVIALLVPRLVPGEAGHRGQGVRRRPESGRATLLSLAGASGAGNAATTSLGAFVVAGGVAAGLHVSTAAWLLSICGVAGVASRILVGLLIDTTRVTPIPVVVVLLLLGSVGYGLQAIGAVTVYVVGALVAHLFGAGWIGLLNLAVVRLNPTAPATASGFVGTGGILGGALGPVVIGVVADTSGFSAAWAVMAGLALTSAGLMVVATVVARRPRPVDSAPPLSTISGGSA
ncbi:MFS transporter [Blastococcus sp. SYSU DS0533]